MDRQDKINPIISDPKKIRKAKANRRFAPTFNRSRLAKFERDRLPAIVQAMNEAFADYYAKLRVPLHLDPDRALTKENYYRLLRACPAYSRSKARARAKLSGNTYHFEVSEYSHPDWAAIYEQIFKNIKNLQEARAHLGDAIFEGRTWLKIIWDYARIRIPSINQTVILKVPVELQYQPKGLFQFQTTQVDDDTILGEWTIGNLATGMREALSDAELFDYLTVAYFPEFRNMYYGEGIDNYAIALVEAIQVLVNYALKFAQNKAEVHVYVKSRFSNLISPELQKYMADGNDMSIERVKNLIKYFVSGKEKGALLLGPDDEAGVLDATGRSEGIYISILNYLDKELETWILGAIGGLESDGGSYAKAESGRQESNDYLAWNQQYLIETPLNELVHKILFAFDYAVDKNGETLLDANGNPIVLYDNYQTLSKYGLTNYKLPVYKQGEVGKEEPRDVIPIIQTIMSIPGAAP